MSYQLFSFYFAKYLLNHLHIFSFIGLMKVLVLVIVSFDKPVYYDMLAVWKKRINEQSLTDGCTTDVWFIQCKSDKEWVGDIVNDLREPSYTPLNEHSLESHSLESHSLESHSLESHSLESHSLESHSLESHSLESHSLKHRFELDRENKTLYVKGDECLIPGILHKTVEALSFFLGTEASQKGGVIGRKHTTDAEQRSSPNYVWRTNLSSVLDFAGLERYLGKISSTKALYSGYVGLGSLNNGSSTFFASGAGFLMSRDVALYLVENKQFLRWDLIDDVAIGALLEPKFGIVPLDRCWVQSGSEDISALVANGIFHFRCESYQHLRTVEFMRYVDECLLRGRVP